MTTPFAAETHHYEHHALIAQIGAVAGAVNIVHGDVGALRIEVHEGFAEMRAGLAALNDRLDAVFNALDRLNRD